MSEKPKTKPHIPAKSSFNGKRKKQTYSFAEILKVKDKVKGQPPPENCHLDQINFYKQLDRESYQDGSIQQPIRSAKSTPIRKKAGDSPGRSFKSFSQRSSGPQNQNQPPKTNIEDDSLESSLWDEPDEGGDTNEFSLEEMSQRTMEMIHQNETDNPKKESNGSKLDMVETRKELTLEHARIEAPQSPTIESEDNDIGGSRLLQSIKQNAHTNPETISENSHFARYHNTLERDTAPTSKTEDEPSLVPLDGQKQAFGSFLFGPSFSSNDTSGTNWPTLAQSANHTSNVFGGTSNSTANSRLEAQFNMYQSNTNQVHGFPQGATPQQAPYPFHVPVESAFGKGTPSLSEPMNINKLQSIFPPATATDGNNIPIPFPVPHYSQSSVSPYLAQIAGNKALKPAAQPSAAATQHEDAYKYTSQPSNLSILNPPNHSQQNTSRPLHSNETTFNDPQSQYLRQVAHGNATADSLTDRSISLGQPHKQHAPNIAQYHNIPPFANSHLPVSSQLPFQPPHPSHAKDFSQSNRTPAVKMMYPHQTEPSAIQYNPHASQQNTMHGSFGHPHYAQPFQPTQSLPQGTFIDPAMLFASAPPAALSAPMMGMMPGIVQNYGTAAPPQPGANILSQVFGASSVNGEAAPSQPKPAASGSSLTLKEIEEQLLSRAAPQDTNPPTW